MVRARSPLAAALAVAVVLGLVACHGTKNSPPAVARVMATTVLSARTRDLTVASPALGETVKVRVLLPAQYAAQPARRWPVLYLLHGCCDTYQSWTRSTDIEKLSAHSNVLVVMPEGGKAGFYSDWLTGPKWETFHLVGLRRILTRDYRAGPAMAIVGVSMGGLGALAYAARHPGLFRAAASFSGIVDTRLTPPGTPPSTIETALAAENAALAERLRALNIPAQFDFYGPGTHNWPYWQQDLHKAWPLLEHALGTD